MWQVAIGNFKLSESKIESKTESRAESKLSRYLA